jgi:hypothetical protein
MEGREKGSHGVRSHRDGVTRVTQLQTSQWPKDRTCNYNSLYIKQQVHDYNELCVASRAPRIRLIKAPDPGLQGGVEILPDTTKPKLQKRFLVLYVPTIFSLGPDLTASSPGRILPPSSPTTRPPDELYASLPSMGHPGLPKLRVCHGIRS